MNLQELQLLVKLGSVLQWFAIIFVFLAGTLQVSKFAIDRKVDGIKEQIVRNKTEEYEQTIGQLKKRIEAQVEELKTVLVQEESRTIPKHVIPKVISELSKFKGASVLVNSLRGDGEALAFAKEIKWIFEEAGWTVNGVTEVQYGPPVKNIVIILKDPAQKSKANYLFSVFKALHFESSAQLNKNQREELGLLIGRRG
ncbi:MAG: hypothetical protein KKE57_01410 [Proteobacteria bacterium]|nr:hypothetical protein [Pseudomonadota bacterium]